MGVSYTETPTSAKQLLALRAPQHDGVLGLGARAEGAALAGAEHGALLRGPCLDSEIRGQGISQIIERKKRTAARDRVADDEDGRASGGERPGEEADRARERALPCGVGRGRVVVE